MAVFLLTQFQTRHNIIHIRLLKTMASSFVKTRHSSGTKLIEYLGTGKDFLSSELPTLRDVLRLGIKYQEEKLCVEETTRFNYPVKELAKDLA